MDSRSSNDSTQKKKTAKLPAKCSRQSWVSEYHTSESEESSKWKIKKSNKSIFVSQRKDKAIEKSTSKNPNKVKSMKEVNQAKSQKQQKSESEVQQFWKIKKNATICHSTRWNTLQCNYCIPEKKWERVEGCKFQSGNITTHMMSVHKDVMEEYRMLDVEKVYEPDVTKCGC